WWLRELRSTVQTFPHAIDTLSLTDTTSRRTHSSHALHASVDERGEARDRNQTSLRVRRGRETRGSGSVRSHLVGHESPAVYGRAPKPRARAGGRHGGESQ